jgi:hypothetical protein
VISWKESTVKNRLVESDEDLEVILDDVIESEAIGMKKEFNIFVERPLVAQIKLLSQNYIEAQDLIKVRLKSLLPIVSSQFAEQLESGCPMSTTSTSTLNSSRSKPTNSTSIASSRSRITKPSTAY